MSNEKTSRRNALLGAAAAVSAVGIASSAHAADPTLTGASTSQWGTINLTQSLPGRVLREDRIFLAETGDVTDAKWLHTIENIPESTEIFSIQATLVGEDNSPFSTNTFSNMKVGAVVDDDIKGKLTLVAHWDKVGGATGHKVHVDVSIWASE